MVSRSEKESSRKNPADVGCVYGGKIQKLDCSFRGEARYPNYPQKVVLFGAKSRQLEGGKSVEDGAFEIRYNTCPDKTRPQVRRWVGREGGREVAVK